MRLTKRHAVNISIELWEWLAETGNIKCEWPDWAKYGYMQSHCPLCEYDARYSKKHHIITCLTCPYYLKFGSCSLYDTPFSAWVNVGTFESRKIYAEIFLAQLKQL